MGLGDLIAATAAGLSQHSTPPAIPITSCRTAQTTMIGARNTVAQNEDHLFHLPKPDRRYRITVRLRTSRASWRRLPTHRQRTRWANSPLCNLISSTSLDYLWYQDTCLREDWSDVNRNLVQSRNRRVNQDWAESNRAYRRLNEGPDTGVNNNTVASTHLSDLWRSNCPIAGVLFSASRVAWRWGRYS